MSWAGAYVLNVHCDNTEAHVNMGGKYGEYVAETGREAKSEARKAGWHISEDGTGFCLCPKCSHVLHTRRKILKGTEHA